MFRKKNTGIVYTRCWQCQILVLNWECKLLCFIINGSLTVKYQKGRWKLWNSFIFLSRNLFYSIAFFSNVWYNQCREVLAMKLSISKSKNAESFYINTITIGIEFAAKRIESSQFPNNFRGAFSGVVDVGLCDVEWFSILWFLR